MAITIKKSTVKTENENITNTILTPKYGEIKIVSNVNADEYSYFDTFNGYDLFINNNGDDTVAINPETLNENDCNVEDEVKNILNKYNVSTVKYDDVESAIIIKANNSYESEIDKIKSDYENNSNYKPEKITDKVLFLHCVNSKTMLEDDDILNKLDDSTVKELASKSGAKLSGSESKDELKGIIKGALSASK